MRVDSPRHARGTWQRAFRKAFPLDDRDSTAGPPATAYRVLLLGFGEFERHALTSYLRLSGSRDPAYQQAEAIEQADFVIADADHPGAIDAVLAAGRAADTVFIGSLAPERALAWAMRPIDPLQVFRELDAAVALRKGERPDDDAPHTTSPGELDAPMRRAGDVNPPTAALVIDDSEIALRYLETRLHRMGMRTERATTSGRALELLSQHGFDFVLLDVELGGASELDGLAVCQQIKRHQHPASGGKPPGVIIVSAHHAELDRARGALAGCDAYLGKPVDETVLLQTLLQLAPR